MTGGAIARSVDGGAAVGGVGNARQDPQLLERVTQQARDVHLRHADAGRDLGLREVLAEAQLEHATLAVGQMLNAPAIVTASSTSA